MRYMDKPSRDDRFHAGADVRPQEQPVTASELLSVNPTANIAP